MNEEYPEDIRDLEMTVYRIKLGGNWTLVDLYDFPRIYSQVYAFAYVLSTPVSLLSEELVDPFIANPWVGGYDAVNFYHQLQARVPKKARPDVFAIRYESPGWLDLSLLMDAALSIRVVVSNVVSAGNKINHLYSSIQKGIADRKLARLDIKRKELELSREHMQFARESADELTRMMSLEGLSQLRSFTNNDLITLKIVLAQFRRVRELAKFVEKGKIEL